MSDTPYFDAYEQRRLEKLNIENATEVATPKKSKSPGYLIEVYDVSSGKEILLDTLKVGKDKIIKVVHV
jgi:hypothetical protein